MGLTRNAAPLSSLIVAKHADPYDPTIGCLLMVAFPCLVLWSVSAHFAKMTTAAMANYHHSYLGPPPQAAFFDSIFAQWVTLLLELALLFEAVVYQKAWNV